MTGSGREDPRGPALERRATLLYSGEGPPLQSLLPSHGCSRIKLCLLTGAVFLLRKKKKATRLRTRKSAEAERGGEEAAAALEGAQGPGRAPAGLQPSPGRGSRSLSPAVPRAPVAHTLPCLLTRLAKGHVPSLAGFANSLAGGTPSGEPTPRAGPGSKSRPVFAEGTSTAAACPVTQAPLGLPCIVTPLSSVSHSRRRGRAAVEARFAPRVSLRKHCGSEHGGLPALCASHHFLRTKS